MKEFHETDQFAAGEWSDDAFVSREECGEKEDSAAALLEVLRGILSALLAIRAELQNK